MNVVKRTTEPIFGSPGDTTICNEEEEEVCLDYVGSRHIGDVLKLCQINVEGLTTSKSKYLERLLFDKKCDILLMQETHSVNEDHLSRIGNIQNFKCVDSIHHRRHGLAIYVSNKLANKCIPITKICDENLEILTIKIDSLHISNIYKPPGVYWMQPPAVFSHPSIYMGDFNSHHHLWGYRTNDLNGEFIIDWALNHELHLIYDSKDYATFHSGRWNTETNPDLCLVSSDKEGMSIPVSRSVGKDFPRSQHRPVFLEIGIQIPYVNSIPLPRWNFRKANWKTYSRSVDMNIRWIPPKVENNARFMGVIFAAAKRCIPRGHRKPYIPSWNPECESLWIAYNESGSKETGSKLLQVLNEERTRRWKELVEQMDFTHSSTKAWNLLKKLGGTQCKSQPVSNISADKIATRLLKNSKMPISKKYTKSLKSSLRQLRKSFSSSPYGGPVSVDEIDTAIKQLKPRKAAGCDGMFPEFFIHLGKNARHWLAKFFSDCYLTGKIPNMWKKSNVRAVLKPGKDKNFPENYRPISLLCIGYKLLERIIYNRIVIDVDENIPAEQAGFRFGRNCCDQVLALTTFIEAGFQDKLKTTVTFIDLTAAYDTVWKKGLLYKLGKILKCKNTINLIDEMLSNRSFVLFMGNKKSRRRRLNDGLPQGAVLAPLYFNVYTSDFPQTLSRKFCYADDMALAIQHSYHANSEAKATQKIENDLLALDEYYTRWKLRPNPAKCEVLTFHLDNNSANHETKINFRETIIPYNQKAKYLGITLDRSLTFKYHCQKLKDKLKSRNNIIQKLAGISWGASANILKISALSLVFSTAEYCAPVWSHSIHTTLIDVQLNCTMRIITGVIKSAQLPWLPILSNIAPSNIRRDAALVREMQKINSNQALPIHMDLKDRNNASNRLISRRPLWSKIEALGNLENFSINNNWQKSFNDAVFFNKQLISKPFEMLPGFYESRRRWTTLNRIRTNAGRTNHTLNLWFPEIFLANCDCGHPDQTMDHIVKECNLRRFDGGLQELHNLSDAAIFWIDNLDVQL